MVNLLLLIPAAIGAILCASSLIFQLLFVVYNIDQGLIGHLQSYSVWSVSIAVIGHLCNASGAYAFDDMANSNGYCIAEAVSLTFGELALVLWQICSAVTAIVVMHPEWLSSEARARQLFAAFHVCVWTPSLVTTAIPWATGLLGFQLSSSDNEGWCWFKIENQMWELGQFYIPLFVYVLIAIAVFVFLIFKVSEFSFSDASLISRRGSAMSTSTRRSSSGNFANGAVAMDDERIAERNMILVRLGIQLFVMPFFFVPDSISYMISISGNTVPDGMYTTTTFIWKLESVIIACVWYSNKRVRECIFKIPFIAAYFPDEAVSRRHSDCSMSSNLRQRYRDSIRTQSFRRYSGGTAANQSAQSGDAPQQLLADASMSSSDWDAMLQARHRTGSTVARRATFVTTAAVCVSSPSPPPVDKVEADAALASDSVSVRVSAAHSAAAAGDSRVPGSAAPTISTILIRKQRLSTATVAASASSFFAFSSRRSRSTGRLVMLPRPRRQRAANLPLPSAASASSPSTSTGAAAASAHATIEMMHLDAPQRHRQSKLPRTPSALVQPVLFALRALPSPSGPTSGPTVSPLMLFDFPVASQRRSTVSGPAPSQSPPPPSMKRVASLWI